MNVDPHREELHHVAGDRPHVGTMRMTAGKIGDVRVRYRDTVVYCEVYQHPGQPMQIHWMCPRCLGGGNGYMSRISADQKRIDFDPKSQVEDGGRLNVEAFTCPWERGEGRRMEFGLGMCGLRIVIENSVARDA
jgi:hypothetical protein